MIILGPWSLYMVYIQASHNSRFAKSAKWSLFRAFQKFHFAPIRNNLVFDGKSIKTVRFKAWFRLRKWLLTAIHFSQVNFSSPHTTPLISHDLCIVKFLPRTSPLGPCGRHSSPISSLKNPKVFSGTVAVLGNGAASPPAKFMRELNLLARSGSNQDFLDGSIYGWLW